MPSDDNRDHEKEAPKQEVLNRSEREALKKEILAELGKSEPKSRIHRIITHPAFLLILGAMTGVLGTSLSSSYTAAKQAEEWNRQQSRLSEQRELDLKYKLIEETTKVVTEYLSALDNVQVEGFLVSNGIGSLQDMEEKFNAWKNINDKRRLDLGVTEQKISLHFSNPEIQPLITDITARSNYSEIAVKHLRTTYKRDENMLYDKNKFDDATRDLTKARSDIAASLKRLVTEMNREIKNGRQ